MRKTVIFFISIALMLVSYSSLFGAKIEDVRLKIYNQEDGVFREGDFEFHFNEFGPYLLEVVISDANNKYYDKKNGLEVIVKIGKRTYLKKAYCFQIYSDKYYVPVFLDEDVICQTITVTARIKCEKESKFEKKFEFSCGE